MVLLINNGEVESVLRMKDVMRVLKQAYRDVDQGLTANRPRTFMRTPTSRGHFTSNTHEGVLTSQGVFDIRIIVSSTAISEELDPAVIPEPGERPNVGLDMLYDIESGDLLAILHDAYLQKMRVQATNAIAAEYLAKQDTKVMALLGSGWQASAAVEAMTMVRPIEKVKVFSRSRENREGFAARMRSVHEEVDMRAVGSPQEAVAEADIVVAATNSLVPVCKGEWLEKGMHLTGVLPREFDLDAYKRADCIVIFNRLHGRDYGLSRGPEEVPLDPPPHAPLLEGAPEIIDLISGKAPGRTNDDQITLFANGGHGWGLDGGPGSGIQFAAVAKLVYDLARDKGLGKELPIEWFQQTAHS